MVATTFLFLSSTSTTLFPQRRATSRPLTRLPHPVVILISADGFRFGYEFKTQTPNIHRLIKNGTEAEHGLIPVFPTLTFPNHYSIATGLYPVYHGIVNNYFIDPETGDEFSMASHDPKWWLGEPLWVTVANSGKRAATVFWPGSEVKKDKWECPPNDCHQYNTSFPYEDRVDSILGYFDWRPEHKIPSLMTLYFEEPDRQGHLYGPDDPEVTTAISRIDAMVGRLIQGLEQRGVLEDVDILFVSDHGMVSNCDNKVIYLDDLSPWVTIPYSWVEYHTPHMAIRPPPGYSPADIVARMTTGLQSGKVENGENLRVFLKEDLPRRLHYGINDRVTPIIGLLDEGYMVKQSRDKEMMCGGGHGYDNDLFSMRSIFIAHGPHFERGIKVPSFVNVEIYNLVTSILDIKGAPNNGSLSFLDSILLAKH
ncbi:hypothetical protein vseg_016248 [Gypsophila vaccaria]